MKETVRNTQYLNLRVVALSALAVIALCGNAAQAGLAPVLPPIIGGTEVQAGDPIAQISVALYNNAEGGLCTGSILTEELIVTAAHCLSKNASDLYVLFNRDVNALVDSEILPVLGAVANPKYDPFSMENDAGDIAIVRIKGKLPAGFHPAKRLPMNHVFTVGQEVVLAGYGIAKEVAVDPQGLTSGVLRKTAGVTIQDPNFALTEILLDQTQGHGACHGDSGGPAYIQSATGELLLWGVTNRGYPNDAPDDCAHGAVYTNINAYQDWITTTGAELMKL